MVVRGEGCQHHGPVALLRGKNVVPIVQEAGLGLRDALKGYGEGKNFLRLNSILGLSSP